MSNKKETKFIVFLIVALLTIVAGVQATALFAGDFMSPIETRAGALPVGELPPLYAGGVACPYT